MNYQELQDAVLGDCHREDYTDLIARFIEQGEALIRSKLEAYGLTYTFTDTDRGGVVTTAEYTLPARVTLVKQMLYNNMILDQGDETLIANYRNVGSVVLYAMRALTVVFAGLPGAGSQMQMLYMGMPARLQDPADTNDLLNDYPQLYIDAASVFVFRRAQDYDSAQAAFTSAIGTLEQINRKMHKQIAGARPSNAYNVSFRSSY